MLKNKKKESEDTISPVQQGKGADKKLKKRTKKTTKEYYQGLANSLPDKKSKGGSIDWVNKMF